MNYQLIRILFWCRMKINIRWTFILKQDSYADLEIKRVGRKLGGSSGKAKMNGHRGRQKEELEVEDHIGKQREK